MVDSEIIITPGDTESSVSKKKEKLRNLRRQFSGPDKTELERELVRAIECRDWEKAAQIRTFQRELSEN